jgi:multicomponent Na+:H+ antiporter subunit C
VTPNLVLCLLVGVLFATGVYLLLARSITRALIGLLLMGNGANILYLVASGRAGRAPIVTGHDSGEMSDPLPQAMVLTAIVITLGMTAFILAMAHRSWQLGESDVVEDDVEDVRIVRRAGEDDLSLSDFVGDEDDEDET